MSQDTTKIKFMDRKNNPASITWRPLLTLTNMYINESILLREANVLTGKANSSYTIPETTSD